MEQNVYIVRDKVANTTLSISIAPTDGAFMRDVLPSVFQMRQKEDIEYIQVATFDMDTCTLKPIPSRVCPMDAYKFPETTTRKLSPEEIIELANRLQNPAEKSKDKE